MRHAEVNTLEGVCVNIYSTLMTCPVCHQCFVELQRAEPMLLFSSVRGYAALGVVRPDQGLTLPI